MKECSPHYYKIENTRQVKDGKIVQKGVCTRCGDIKFFQVLGSQDEIYRALPQKEKVEYPERIREMTRQKFLFTLGAK